MIILDKPYVSDFLKKTISDFKIPVIKTGPVNSFNLNSRSKLISELKAVEIFKNNPSTKIYTNSENAISWIAENLSFSQIPEKINLFKDKFLFRELTHNIYPDFYYKLVKLEDFDDLVIENIPKPFIIKPAIGFFSMAVYKVRSNEDWQEIKIKIKNELKAIGHLYPKEVMEPQRFIIEEIIEGEEFAFDAYYNSEGESFVLNVMKHVFASGNDFSDRLYITSEKIIRDNLKPMECFLRDIGMYAGLKNFPLHVEVRIDSTGKMKPIEVNPLRFGAWCTTADATWFAYNYNSIATYLNNEIPDWEQLLANKEGKIYAMMVLENSTGYEVDKIKMFNYEKLLAGFEKPLELRKIDYQKYPVFGFLFTETREENYRELEHILYSDLREYVNLY